MTLRIQIPLITRDGVTRNHIWAHNPPAQKIVLRLDWGTGHLKDPEKRMYEDVEWELREKDGSWFYAELR